METFPRLFVLCLRWRPHNYLILRWRPPVSIDKNSSAQKVKAFSTFKGQTIQLDCLTLEMELIGCPETSDTNYKSTLCNIPEELRLIHTAVEALNQALSLHSCCISTGHFHWHLVVTYVSWFHPCLYGAGVCSVVQGLATYDSKARSDPRKYQSVPQPYSNSYKGNITRDSKTRRGFFFFGYPCEVLSHL